MYNINDFFIEYFTVVYKYIIAVSYVVLFVGSVFAKVGYRATSDVC